jgi:peptidoglycan/LPS O-acetylase OafA/YrhL
MTRFNVALAGICLLAPGACATPNFHFEGLAAVATALACLCLAAACRPQSRLRALLSKPASLARL